MLKWVQDQDEQYNKVVNLPDKGCYCDHMHCRLDIKQIGTLISGAIMVNSWWDSHSTCN